MPAVMTLLARAAWWLPGWVDRFLPRISIEGSEYFARLEAERPPAKDPVSA